jgi:hypothetical protein
MKPENHQPAMHRDMVGGHAPRPLHYHGDHRRLSRRQFLNASGLLVGAVAGGLPWPKWPALTADPGRGIPSQLPDFSPVLYELLGIEIPWFTPPEVDPFTGVFNPVANPTSIWDFNGSFGLLEADGVSDPNINSDGVARRWSCDVRYMTGVFRDRAGRTQQGHFATSD